MAADTLAVADGLGLERFGIVTHDIGSFVAQVVTRYASDRVAELFFNCAYPGIGARWVARRHLLEIGCQCFQQQPWAAERVESSRDL